jgi:hypothetical protein
MASLAVALLGSEADDDTTDGRGALCFQLAFHQDLLAWS